MIIRHIIYLYWETFNLLKKEILNKKKKNHETVSKERYIYTTQKLLILSETMNTWWESQSLSKSQKRNYNYHDLFHLDLEAEVWGPRVSTRGATWQRAGGERCVRDGWGIKFFFEIVSDREKLLRDLILLCI